MSDSVSSMPTGATGAGGGSMLRITGLNTGLDVDAIVKKMLKGDQAKLDKVKQSQQLIQWRQDAYKTIIGDIQDLQNSFFDVSDSDTYLLNQDNYSNMNAVSDNPAFVNATAQTGAAAGTYKISVSQVAQAAVIEGSQSLSSQAELHTIQENGTITIGGTTISVSSFSGNIDDLVNNLNSKINNTTLRGIISVSNDNGKVKFTNSSGNYIDLTSSTISDINNMRINANSFNETAPINQNQDFSGWKGTGKSISFSIGDTTPATTATLDLTQFNGSTASDLVSYINNQITSNSSLTGKISASYVKNGNDEYIKFTPLDSDSKIKVESSTVSDMNSLAGKNLVSASANTKLTDLGSGLNGKITLNLNYNGKEVSVQVDNSSSGENGSATVKDLVAAISSATGGAVTGKFDDTTGKFTLQTTASGSVSSLKIEQYLSTDTSHSNSTSTSLLTALGMPADALEKSYQGSDAEVTVTGIDGNTTTMTESSNSFTVNGINYNVTGKTTDPVSISVTSDTTKIYDKISKFIDKYNKVVSEIQTKLTEKGDKDYPPLTDDKKSSMNSTDIANYEAKAKQGILRNDQNMENLLYSLESAFSTVVQDGNGNDATSLRFGRYGTNAIGVDLSGNSEQPAELTIVDSTKLKDAIANHGDDVMKLFTTTFNSALNNRYNIANSDLSGWRSGTIDLQSGDTDVSVDMSGFSGTSLDSLATYINNKISSTSLKDIVSVSTSVDASGTNHIKFTASRDVYMKATGISDLPTSSTKMLSDKDANFNQSGIFSRISDILDDNVGEVGTSLNNATLTQFANYQDDFSLYGGTGDTLPDQIYQKQQQIKDLTDQMTSDETKYYNEFTNLEVVMQQLNSQQSALSMYTSS